MDYEEYVKDNIEEMILSHPDLTLDEIKEILFLEYNNMVHEYEQALMEADKDEC